jgi:predicted Zn-dependent protease
MTILIKHKAILDFVLAATLLVRCSPLVARSAPATTSYSIDLQEFRWTKFPLKVLVDMNQWSVPDYAVAVREALNSWMKSVWNYTHSFNDTSLTMINYVFYVSITNTTDDYDVLVTFTPNGIPPGSHTVGLTTYSWDISTHEPIPPITINITTDSATASNMFVENIAMHEFGHALGLGHAASQNTLNGPELMYYASSKNQIVYPSTLDIYGLTALYKGKFSQSVQLPFDMPYIMLAEGTVTTPATSLWEDYKKYIPIVGVLFLLIIVAVVLGQIGKEKKPEETTPQPPPPPPNDASRGLT